MLDTKTLRFGTEKSFYQTIVLYLIGLLMAYSSIKFTIYITSKSCITYNKRFL